jgi:hypothetical protein
MTMLHLPIFTRPILTLTDIAAVSKHLIAQIRGGQQQLSSGVVWPGKYQVHVREAETFTGLVEP